MDILLILKALYAILYKVNRLGTYYDQHGYSEKIEGQLDKEIAKRENEIQLRKT